MTLKRGNVDDDWPVYRTKPLPRGELRGRYLIAEPVVAATKAALVGFALAGIRDGGHEGIAFWAGRETAESTMLLKAIIPNADHSAQRVMVSRAEIGRVARAARNEAMGILSQVHSHPGSDARHSDGDDHLILLPFENMLSIVAPHFGQHFTNMGDVCVHQYQRGTWVLCSPESVADRVTIVSSSLDLR
jgi:proteasome lid subunit RPN8/RPN11